MNARPHRYIGLMSGTSLDGVDAALVDLESAPKLIDTRYTAFPTDLREEWLRLHAPGHAELHRAALVSNRLGMLYAETVQRLLSQTNASPRDIAAIGCHGQTVRHRPDEGYSLQLNNASLLAEYTGITVVSDFRSRDIAAGGNGAPPTPWSRSQLECATSRRPPRYTLCALRTPGCEPVRNADGLRVLH